MLYGKHMLQNLYIIIPCFNEDLVLRTTVSELMALGYKVIIVDDASTIPAKELLQDLPLHIVRHPINLGQGAALQTGMDYALKLGADAVVHFDADGQHSAEDIPRFLETLNQGYDIVLGSRFLRTADKNSIPAKKRIVLQAARIVNLLFCGLWLTDAHNGFRALNKNALQKIRLQENRMAHASEILQQIKKNKLKVCEIPTFISYTEYSLQKGQKISNSLNIFLDLLLRKLL